MQETGHAKSGEIYAQHCSISKFFVSCYITFYKETSTCGSQVGSYMKVFCGSVGQMGQLVQPTFNSDAYVYLAGGHIIIIIYIIT